TVPLICAVEVCAHPGAQLKTLTSNAVKRKFKARFMSPPPKEDNQFFSLGGLWVERGEYNNNSGTYSLLVTELLSLLKTTCFNSSRPAPVTEEILINSRLFFLVQRSSFSTFSGIATSIFAATMILGLRGRSGLCSASSDSIS